MFWLWERHCRVENNYQIVCFILISILKVIKFSKSYAVADGIFIYFVSALKINLLKFFCFLRKHQFEMFLLISFVCNYFSLESELFNTDLVEVFNLESTHFNTLVCIVFKSKSYSNFLEQLLLFKIMEHLRNLTIDLKISMYMF